jgi:hypothetical protein
VFFAIFGQDGWPTDTTLEYGKGWEFSFAIELLRTMLTISSVVPSFILISSAWYSRKDQPLRFGILFGANGLAQIVVMILITQACITWNNIRVWRVIFSNVIALFGGTLVFILLFHNKGELLVGYDLACLI